jgi:hypothetical protein
MQRTPDADWPRPDLLIRARDLLAEFSLIKGIMGVVASQASREHGPALAHRQI